MVATENGVDASMLLPLGESVFTGDGGCGKAGGVTAAAASSSRRFAEGPAAALMRLTPS